MESCERDTHDLFSAMLSSKGYWYSLFDLYDTSFSLSQLFGVSIDELLDVFEIVGFVKRSIRSYFFCGTEYATYSVAIHARSAGVQM